MTSWYWEMDILDTELRLYEVILSLELKKVKREEQKRIHFKSFKTFKSKAKTKKMVFLITDDLDFGNDC